MQVSRKTTEDLIADAVEYNPSTGIFTRKITTSRSAAGDKTGTIAKNGYVVLRINKKLHYAHRLAFLMVTGSWPDSQVDHINGMRSDNRFENLRLCNQSENMQNQRRAKNGSESGILGAHFDRSTGRWFSQIKANGVNIALGSFPNARLAGEAYLKAKRKMHAFCTI